MMCGSVTRWGSDESGSAIGGVPALARRALVRELLRSVQAHSPLVLGDLLDHRRNLFVAAGALAVRGDPDTPSVGRPGLNVVADLVLVLVLGGDVGTRGAHLRADHALPGAVLGNGGGAGTHDRDRYDRPASVSWGDRGARRDTEWTDHIHRHRDYPGGNRRRRPCRTREGTRRRRHERSIGHG